MNKILKWLTLPNRKEFHQQNQVHCLPCCLTTLQAATSHFKEVSSCYRCTPLELLQDTCKDLQDMKSLRLPWNLCMCITDTWSLAGVRSWSSEKTGCASGWPWRRMPLRLHPEAWQWWPPAAGQQQCPRSGALQGTCVHPGGQEGRAASKGYPYLGIASPRWRTMENRGNIPFKHMHFCAYLECQWDAMMHLQ